MKDKQSNSITVEEYDAAEIDGIIKLPNRIVEAFRPFHFHEVGYPVKVTCIDELWKYIDQMHELRFENDFTNLLGGGLTENEFELYQKIIKNIYAFTKSNFNKPLLPRASFLRMLNVLRHIRYIFGEKKPRVFEIGPGSGYLGAMLISEGYSYASTDITQAFYLYQNHLFNSIIDGNIIEMANKNHTYANKKFPVPSPGETVHIPWWIFSDIKIMEDELPSFDVITCNHVLSEMSEASRKFSLKTVHTMLSGNSNPKVFIFEGWGWGSLKEKITKEFYQCGYFMVHNDPLITIFISSDRLENNHLLSLQNLYRPPRYRVLRNLFRKLVLRPSLPTSYFSIDNFSTKNPISQAILAGRQAQENVRTIDIKQVNDYYINITGSENLLTPDEIFMRYVEWD